MYFLKHQQVDVDVKTALLCCSLMISQSIFCLNMYLWWLGKNLTEKIEK